MKLSKTLFLTLSAVWLLNSCSKEVDLSQIDGISQAVSNYQDEIRIEAILYPADSTVLVRIDKTYSLTEDSLYNCIDENGDWESYTDINANGQWDPNEPLNDDLGEDGQAGDPTDEDGDFNTSEPSIGEGNGLPDCGEPHVDNYPEILPQVHVMDCSPVRITGPDGEIYPLHFDPQAARLISYPEYDPTLTDAESYWYGGYVNTDPILFPENSTTPPEDRIYQFYADCGDYGVITGTDTLAMPVRFYADSLGQSPFKNNIENYPEISDILNQGDCAIENFMFLFMSAEELATQPFYYYSNPETRSFWSTAFEVTQINLSTCVPKLNYIFGYPAFSSEGYEPGDSVRIVQDVIAEIPGIYQFQVKAMSRAYENYFLYTDLEMHDPVRSNLRDQDGNVIMGTFGGLTQSDLFTIVLPPPYLSIGEVTPTGDVSGVLEIDISSYIRSGDFEFTVTGVLLNGSSGGAVGDDPNWVITTTSEGQVSGIITAGSYLLSSTNHLLDLQFSGLTGEAICISRGSVFVPMASEDVPIFTGPCVTFP